jgi:hypothetical protein
MAEVTLTSLGAVADARELRDAAIAVSTNILTSPSAPFAEGDVGKPIVIAGAGASGAKLRTTIDSFISATDVTLADAAATTVIAEGAVFGTDCSAALQQGLDGIVASSGGTLIIDGLFFLALPVEKAFGGETTSVVARVIGTGDSGFWIGTEGGADAIGITSGAVEFYGLNFLGVPGASRDARRVLNFSALSVSLEHCSFYGLLAQEAVVYSTEGLLGTHSCLFGGCFVAGGTAGYVNSVVENKNWLGYHDEYSQFIDYGYFRGQVYSKSGFSGTLAWVRADTPLGQDGTRGESVFSLRGTRCDEGSLYGIVAWPTSGTIAHVRLIGLRQNVTPAETGRGIHCQNVQSAVIEQCWMGWATSPALLGHFQDCGTILIDSLKLSDSVNGLSATNVESLTLKDTAGVTSFAFSNVNFHPVTSRYGSLATVKSGAVSDSDFPSPPALGTLAFDRTNNRLYAKRLPAGGWIYFSMGGGDPFGPELVVNGTFDSGTTGWTAANSATLTVTGGVLRVVNGTIYGRAYQSVPTVAGQQYQVSIGIVGGDAGRIARVGTTQGAATYANFVSTGGTATFTATSATTFITLMVDSESAGKYAEFDNVSLKAM